MQRSYARNSKQILAIALFALLNFLSARVLAAVTNVVGSVTSAGHPIAGVTIRVTGPTSFVAHSDAHGRFVFDVTVRGTYQIAIVEPGFRPYHRNTALPGKGVLAIVLEPTTLPVIGSVTGVARAPFNATPVAQRIFPREAYRDQGQPSTATVLAQTPNAFPGLATTTNGAASLPPIDPLVRGGIPFETPTLLDGAPISLPSSGTFDLSLLPTYVLQEVEVIQGPGDPAGAGSGVGGALNLRLAEPTLPVRGMLELSGDSRGGQFSDLAYDGTLPGGKFAFATMESIDGDAGPLNQMDIGVPGNALRKAALLKLRMTPNRSLTVTTTYLGVNLYRALGADDGVFLPDGTYGALLPSADTSQYESLRFMQALARLDRGSDGFDARVYGLDLSNATQSGASGVISNAFDGERGGGLKWRHQAEHDLYAIGLDASGGNANTNDRYTTPIALGSNQTSLRARATAALHPTPRDEIDLAAAIESLNERAAPDGHDFQSHAWSPASARIGYSHTLAPTLALRGAFGTSAVTPPLAALSGGPAVLQTYVAFPARMVAFGSDVNEIERASGGDIGLEWRLHGNTTTLSADWYENATHGAYVLESEPVASNDVLERWFNGPPMLDQGVQLSLVQFKPVGMGFIAQIAFPRTYVVGPLPPDFYTNGNLAIIPGQNVAGGAFFTPGENDVAPIRVPYAQGYTEISYKWPRGSRLSLGMLYEGANNAYARPAFGTFNSNLELSLGPKAKLQLSVENIFDALDSRLPLAYQGIGVPLANSGGRSHECKRSRPPDDSDDGASVVRRRLDYRALGRWRG